MAKTFSEWIATLSAVTGLGAGDKMPVVEGGVTKYVEGDDLGGGITALTGDVTASGTGSVATTIANLAVTNAKVATGIDAAKIADGTVSNAEFQYLGGVTSDIQTQLNAKQASGADLTTIAGLTPSNDDFLQRKAGAWANRTVAQVKTDLGVPTYARYMALLTQYEPTTATSGTLNIGQTYTITTFVPGDDFSNVASVQSGTINTNGCVFIATGEEPTNWTNGSELSGTGVPTSFVLENTLGGSVVWSYDAAGTYIATLANAFTPNKTVVIVGNSIASYTSSGVGVVLSSADVIILETFVIGGANTDGVLRNTAIEIRVYP